MRFQGLSRAFTPTQWGPEIIGLAWGATFFGRGVGAGQGNEVLLGSLSLVLLLGFVAWLRGGSLTLPLDGVIVALLGVGIAGTKVLASPYPSVEFRFMLEIVLLVCLPIAVARLWENRPDHGRLTLILALLGVWGGTSAALWVLSGGNIGRRLDFEEVLGIGSAVNLVGHGFAIGATCAGFRAVSVRAFAYAAFWWILSGVCVLGVFLSGSRSSMAGLAMGSLILLIAGQYQSSVKNRATLALGSLVLAASAIWALPRFMTSGSLRYRFSAAGVAEDGAGRLGVLISSLRGMYTEAAPWESWLGLSAVNYAPLRNAAYMATSVRDPHNLFGSAFVYLGPVFGVAVALVIPAAMWIGWKNGRRGLRAYDWLPLALMFVSLTYSLSSGRLTRTFSVWIALGIIWGERRRMRRLEATRERLQEP